MRSSNVRSKVLDLSQEASLAQADHEWIQRKGKMATVSFAADRSNGLIECSTASGSDRKRR